MIDRFLELLEGFYDRYREKKRQNREIADDALRAVSTALRETKIYYAGIDRGRQKDDEKELQLSRLWAAAAIPLRHVDPEFAGICEDKSEYWLNPDRWDEESIDKVNIRLSTVDARFRNLLTPFNRIARRAKTPDL